MIPLKKASLPSEMANWLEERQQRLNALLAAKEEVPESLTSSYRDSKVKQLIKSETFDKCAYCESKILHVDHGDVEHLLPKSLFPQFCLTYSNLTFVCRRCNQFKSAYHNDEAPLLNPYTDNPSDDLTACGPMVVHVLNRVRGYLTIHQLRLNRLDLLERRMERIDRLIPLIEKVALETRSMVREALIQALLQEMEPDKEYSFTIRAYFATHHLIFER